MNEILILQNPVFSLPPRTQLSFIFKPLTFPLTPKLVQLKSLAFPSRSF